MRFRRKNFFGGGSPRVAQSSSFHLHGSSNLGDSKSLRRIVGLVRQRESNHRAALELPRIVSRLGGSRGGGWGWGTETYHLAGRQYSSHGLRKTTTISINRILRRIYHVICLVSVSNNKVELFPFGSSKSVIYNHWSVPHNSFVQPCLT